MYLREIVINNVKREQKMTETFGHSNIFATLSLSQALAYKRGNNTFYFTRRSPALIYGFPWRNPRETALFF